MLRPAPSLQEDSVAYNSAQLAALEKAIASGHLTIEYSNGGVTYRTTYQSLKEMKSARKDILDEIGDTSHNRFDDLGVNTSTSKDL